MGGILSFNFTISTSIIFPALALIGNAIVFAVFIGKDIRNQSINIYFAAQAISEALEVITTIMVNLTTIMNFTDSYCKFAALIGRMFYQNCTYLKALVSIDRLLSVKYSKKFQFRNKYWFQILMILIGVVYSFGISAPYYVYCGKIDGVNRTESQCFFFRSYGCFLFEYVLPKFPI